MTCQLFDEQVSGCVEPSLLELGQIQAFGHDLFPCRSRRAFKNPQEVVEGLRPGPYHLSGSGYVVRELLAHQEL